MKNMLVPAWIGFINVNHLNLSFSFRLNQSESKTSAGSAESSEQLQVLVAQTESGPKTRRAPSMKCGLTSVEVHIRVWGYNQLKSEN